MRDTVQVDPVFEGLDGGPGSLVKWNPLTSVSGLDVWRFLRTMNVPVNALHSQVAADLVPYLGLRTDGRLGCLSCLGWNLVPDC